MELGDDGKGQDAVEEGEDLTLVDAKISRHAVNGQIGRGSGKRMIM